MIRNHFIARKPGTDIAERVDLVLRKLGNPEPPLNLAAVRRLLGLELRFYPTDDKEFSLEAVSKIMVSTMHVYRRQLLLIEAIRRFDLSALYLSKWRSIFLDPRLPDKKHRWSEAHEIGHTLIPWHGNAAFGDNRHTLSPECRRRIESEANFAAARLLFLGDRFGEEARSREPSIDTVLELQRLFGNSITTTLYRLVESAARGRPIVGLITRYPSAEPADDSPELATRREHFVRSPAFARHFKGVQEDELFKHIAAYCKQDYWGGPLGESELVLADDNGVRQRFHFETFFNHYDALTLGAHVGPARFDVAASL